jgi:hypothetical protein
MAMVDLIDVLKIAGILAICFWIAIEIFWRPHEDMNYD